MGLSDLPLILANMFTAQLWWVGSASHWRQSDPTHGYFTVKNRRKKIECFCSLSWSYTPILNLWPLCLPRLRMTSHRTTSSDITVRLGSPGTRQRSAEVNRVIIAHSPGVWELHLAGLVAEPLSGKCTNGINAFCYMVLLSIGTRLPTWQNIYSRKVVSMSGVAERLITAVAESRLQGGPLLSSRAHAWHAEGCKFNSCHVQLENKPKWAAGEGKSLSSETPASCCRSG